MTIGRVTPCPVWQVPGDEIMEERMGWGCSVREITQDYHGGRKADEDDDEFMHQSGNPYKKPSRVCHHCILYLGKIDPQVHYFVGHTGFLARYFYRWSKLNNPVLPHPKGRERPKHFPGWNKALITLLPLSEGFNLWYFSFLIPILVLSPSP